MKAVKEHALEEIKTNPSNASALTTYFSLAKSDYKVLSYLMSEFIKL
jgi:hypothetical protein